MAYGDVPHKCVTVSLKLLRYGSHFGQKNPEKGPTLKKNCEKEAEKSLEMGLNLKKKKKKSKKLSNQPFFEWEKSLDRGFGPRAAHCIKKKFKCPP